jgi:hypothetical protein
LLRSGTEHQDYRIPRQEEQSAVRGVELMLVGPMPSEVVMTAAPCRQRGDPIGLCCAREVSSVEPSGEAVAAD